MENISALLRNLVAKPFLFIITAAFIFIFFYGGLSKQQKNNENRSELIQESEQISPASAPKGSAGLGAKYKQSAAMETFGAGAPAADAPANTPSLIDLLSPVAHAQQSAMLIRNGYINAYVDSLAKTKTKLSEILKAHTVRIDNESQRDEYNSTVLNMTLKVPAEKFQALFDDILKISEKIRNHSVNVDDVIKQYTDVKSRLENKIELQKRFRALAQKAVKVSDILEIERELARISEEIDSSTQIMKQYENDVRLSTITLDLTEPKAETEKGPAPFGFFKKVGLALQFGWELILNTILDIISWWPLWILIGLAYLWWQRWSSKQD